LTGSARCFYHTFSMNSVRHGRKIDQTQTLQPSWAIVKRVSSTSFNATSIRATFPDCDCLRSPCASRQRPPWGSVRHRCHFRSPGSQLFVRSICAAMHPSGSAAPFFCPLHSLGKSGLEFCSPAARNRSRTIDSPRPIPENEYHDRYFIFPSLDHAHAACHHRTCYRGEFPRQTATQGSSYSAAATIAAGTTYAPRRSNCGAGSDVGFGCRASC